MPSTTVATPNTAVPTTFISRDFFVLQNNLMFTMAQD